MLIPGRTRRLGFLRAAREQLGPGSADAALLLRARSRWSDFPTVAAIANTLRRLRGFERVDVGDTIDRNYVHCFTRDEIEAELAAGGFRLVTFESEPYGHTVAVAA